MVWYHTTTKQQQLLQRPSSKRVYVVQVGYVHAILWKNLHIYSQSVQYGGRGSYQKHPEWEKVTVLGKTHFVVDQHTCTLRFGRLSVPVGVVG
jgi:hypothetical protein